MSPWTVTLQAFLSSTISRCSESHSVVSNSLWLHGLYSAWNSPGQNTGVGSLSLLQGFFPTQGLNPCLLHCRRILYQLNHKGSPGISQSLLKFMSTEPVMSHLILCHPLLLLPSTFPSIRVFSNGGWLFTAGHQSIGAWFPLGWTGLILQSKRFSRVFSSTTVWKDGFSGAQPSLWSNSCICTWPLENP